MVQGLARGPLKAEIRVRIPVSLPKTAKSAKIRVNPWDTRNLPYLNYAGNARKLHGRVGWLSVDSMNIIPSNLSLNARLEGAREANQ